MKTICKPGHPVPYSLHDMRVGSIALSDGQLTLGLDTGLYPGEGAGRPHRGGILRGVAAQPQWAIREFFGEKADLAEVFPEAPGVLLRGDR